LNTKKAIGVVILMVYRFSYGQDYHFSQFMSNMIYINPACAALPVSPEAGLTYRNQWPGIPATFVTYGASFVMPIQSLSSGAGIQFANDIQGGGVISRTSASLLYGYIFNINRYWQIGAGLNASWVMKKLNANDLVFRADLLSDLGYGVETIPVSSYTKGYPDFGFGLVARNNNDLSFGVSVAHLTRPFDSYSDYAGNRVPLRYSAFITGRAFGSDQLINNTVTANPALYYSYQHNNSELLWGSQFTMASYYSAGIWLRQNTKFNFESLIVSLGISFEKYNIGYSYDVNLKKINFLSTKMAAHEVTFLYRFEYKGRKFKQVECPTYK
jgi:type IX secretion system PorP/SprF family membrane protein